MDYQIFQKGAGPNKITGPISQRWIDEMKDCDLVDVRVAASHGLMLPKRLSTKKGQLKAAEEVKLVRDDVKAGKFPRWFLEKYYPEEWGEFPKTIPGPLANEGLSFDDPKGLAKVVHMDDPMDMPLAVAKWVRTVERRVKGANGKFSKVTGYPLKRPASEGKFKDFGPQLIDIPEEMRDVQKELHPKCFSEKYRFVVARPEEVLKDKKLTAYPEGCPTHASYPAGHATFACPVKVLMWRYELDDTAVKVLRDCAYIWAMCRTLAGVHYAEDNIAGLFLGGILDRLPAWFEVYG